MNWESFGAGVLTTLLFVWGLREAARADADRRRGGVR